MIDDSGDFSRNKTIEPLKTEGRAEVYTLVKYLACKHKNSDWIPRTLLKKPVVMLRACNPGVWKEKTWGLLLS